MAWAVLLRMYAQRGLSASVALLRLITLTAPLESAEELIEALPRLLRGSLILPNPGCSGWKETGSSSTAAITALLSVASLPGPPRSERPVNAPTPAASAPKGG